MRQVPPLAAWQQMLSRKRRKNRGTETTFGGNYLRDKFIRRACDMSTAPLAAALTSLRKDAAERSDQQLLDAYAVTNDQKVWISTDGAAHWASISTGLPGVPIRVQWTREDDLMFSYYNAVSHQFLKAALDADGHPTALLQRSAFTSVLATLFVIVALGIFVSFLVLRAIAQLLGLH